MFVSGREPRSGLSNRLAKPFRVREISIRTSYGLPFGNKGIVLQIYFQISLLRSARCVCEYATVCAVCTRWKRDRVYVAVGAWFGCVYGVRALVCVTIVTNAVIRSVRHTISRSTKLIGNCVYLLSMVVLLLCCFPLLA